MAMSDSAREHTRLLPAFKAVCEQFGLEDQWYTAAAEDYHLTLEGEIQLTRFVVVTRGNSGSDEIIYVEPGGNNLQSAVYEALRHAEDPIYAQVPVAVVDLDSLEIFRPQWSAMPWWSTPETVQLEIAA